MAQDDTTFGTPGGEPTPTPEAAPPIHLDFMSSVMARFARQDEVQKTTNDQLDALVAALTAQDGQTSRPQMIRRRLFNTNLTATEPLQHAPRDKNSHKDGYMYIVNENNILISTMVVRGEGWNKWAHRGYTFSTNLIVRRQERRRAYTRRSRDVLKRKLESKDYNSSGNTDLRLTLNARKSQRTSTGGPDPKGHPTRLIGDLRDKHNARVCNLRVLLNSSKPTDLRRRLEQTKMPANPTLS
ncbi:hypothetical protein F2Q69_00030468 [Brassica cretica]|uniref:Uncharacterized protein n=1 Tax=Brassica cretica TaxID=69181 RepID=A0A8S9RY69_BRACR|nr:hypothetical protein F2Q69_00030468 [Brassica cretica]